MGSSMAGTAAAFVFAGATIATGGGAGIAVLGAANLGAGATAAASAVGVAAEGAADRIGVGEHDRAGTMACWCLPCGRRTAGRPGRCWRLCARLVRQVRGRLLSQTRL